MNGLKRITGQIIAVCLAMFLFASVVPETMAAGYTYNVPVSVAQNGIASPTAEDEVWRYRIYNGKRQKRLWSIAENRWLTDWIDY